MQWVITEVPVFVGFTNEEIELMEVPRDHSDSDSTADSNQEAKGIPSGSGGEDSSVSATQHSER